MPNYGQLWEAVLEVPSAAPRTVRVRVDQRDYAAYEGSDLYDEEAGVGRDGRLAGRAVTKFRHLTFTALRRTGEVPKSTTWQEFNEDILITTDAVPEESEETGEEGDPT